MRAFRVAWAGVALAAVVCAGAVAAEKKTEPFTVVHKDESTDTLHSFRVGYEEEVLFGSSFKKLDKLPLRTERLRLEVPIKNLAKIEFLEVDKDAKRIKVRLTSVKGQVKEGVLEGKNKLVWQGTHTFADSEVALDPAKMKEIRLKPAKE